MRVSTPISRARWMNAVLLAKSINDMLASYFECLSPNGLPLTLNIQRLKICLK
jgi:hypothetical protein